MSKLDDDVECNFLVLDTNYFGSKKTEVKENKIKLLYTNFQLILQKTFDFWSANGQIIDRPKRFFYILKIKK